MKALMFEVPGPPVPKARPRAGRWGRFYTPQKTVAYERHVGSCALAAVLANRKWVKTSEYQVQLDIYYRDKRSGDLDNLEKSILDGMQGVVYDNDKQVAASIKRRHYDKEHPRVCVKVLDMGKE